MAGLRDKTAPCRSGEELDLSRLEPFLQSTFPGENGPLSVSQFPDGHSNLTYLISMGPREMVLRRPPFGSKVKSAHDMGREFRVLSKLHAAFPEAPEVLCECDDLSVIGAPFYVMKPISGIVLRRDPPADVEFSPHTARQLSKSFVDVLARLHGLDFASIGLGELGRPQGYMERQVNGWIERYRAAKTSELDCVEKIVSWLQRNIPPSSGAALIHNDYKYDNVILDAGDITKVVGVLDWEMCTIGDPLSDLGGALAYWVDASDPPELEKIRWGPTNVPGSLTRAELIQRYAEKTGCDVANMVFYVTFARFKIAVIVQQIYYRYSLGLTRDERFAAMPEKIENLLNAALNCAETGAL